LVGSYLTAAEGDALIAERLASFDQRRTAWESLPEADRNVCLRAATRDLDACNWQGRPTDSDQGLAWPRIERSGACVYGLHGSSVPLPDSGEITEWSRAGVPLEILVACAIQAAHKAHAALGLSEAAQLDADAQRGVTARSGTSGSVSLDPVHSRSPRARLDPDALAACEGLLAWGGDLA
ncbi:MAG: hypothetical protein KDA05_10060, partial [Phycisphaerales bacterium]|nr:hypothetical protein [Phycisphaerales bacterium]